MPNDEQKHIYPAPLLVDDDEDGDSHWCPPLDRRAAVRLLSLSTLATVTGCSSSSTASTGTSTTSSSSTTTLATTTVLTVSTPTVATGAGVTLTATVSPSAASGSVTFYDGTTALGTSTLTTMGTATFTYIFSTAGVQSLTADYTGFATYAASSSAAVSLTVTTSTAACSATLEGEQGPYFVDDSAAGYLRSNILSNLDGSDTQTGVPLTLTVYVFDSEKSCNAMQSVQVDIWSCNASGIYSAESSESTVGQSWLRGYQLTDATGKVQFQTIVPGWYSGRTTHIHMRFRSTYDETDNSDSNTMQVFFDQTLINTLATSVSPYSSEGINPTTNASDRVYSTQEDGTTLLTLSGSMSAGYTATVKIYLPI